MSLTRRALLSSLSFALVPSFALAQSRPPYLDQPAEIRVVGSAANGERLPLLVVLPSTGMSAGDVYDELQSHVGLANYVVVIPQGAPSRSDYESSFSRFLDGFDARLRLDLQRAQATYPVDADRVYLIGFSLGGDLAWGLLSRRGAAFRGAYIMASRCSATMTTSNLAAARARGARIAFAVGDHDDPGRAAGLRAAARRVDAAGVATHTFEFAGGHQLPTDPGAIDAAFRFLFDRR
jgi:predicted esterase